MATMKHRFVFLPAFLLWGSSLLQAQPKTAADSAGASRTDSTQRVAEAYLLRQIEQQQIDSLITLRLKAELEGTNNDARRKRALEDSLRQLSAREAQRKADQVARIATLKQDAVGYPVVLLTDTLFYIYTRSGSFTAAERAAAVSKRIETLYDDAFFDADSLALVQNESTPEIVYKRDNVIMSVSELDALWLDAPADTLATRYLHTIQKVVAGDREANSFFNWLLRIVYTLLIIAGIWLIIRGVNYLFSRLFLLMKNRQDAYFTGFTVRKVQVLSPVQHYQLSVRGVNVLRMVVIILAIYLALPLLFAVFPQTEALAGVLWGWIITPAKAIAASLIHFLPNLFTIVVVYFATRYLLKIVHYFASETEKGNIQLPGFYKEWTWPTFNIIRFLAYAFMFVVIFPYLPGSHSPAFQGVSVFLGVLISLGSSSAISNIIAGLVITYMRPFKVGDRVKISDVVGDVIEKTMLVTRIRTIKNEDITVPNSTVLNSHTINYSANAQSTGLIVHTTVTMGYDVPWQDVYELLLEAALRTEHVQRQPQPFVLHTSLDDFYISYQVNAYTKEPNRQAAIYSSLHRNIQDVCNERGIELMSPHYSAMRDGSQTTIPPDHLSPGYKKPGFNVNIRQYRAGGKDGEQ